MSEQMDVDDYPRDERERSRSPRRERSPRRADSGFRGGGYRDRYEGRAGGRRYGSRDNYRGGRDSETGKFSSNGAYADKTNRNYSKSVFIGNLPFDCSWGELKEHFLTIGDVTRADIVTSHGQSRGMGTVEFRNESDVQRAINKFNHTTFMDREIFVREDNPPPEKRDSGRDRFRDSYRGSRDSYSTRGDSYRSGRDNYRERDSYRGGRDAPRSASKGYEVFVGNLPFRTNWQDLKDLFRGAGDVLHADVRLDDSGRSKGYGIVTYATREEVYRAIQKFQGYDLDGRQIDVRNGKNNARLDDEKEVGEPGTVGDDVQASGEEESEFSKGVEGNGEKSDTVFVGNLPFSTFNEDLYDLFESVGPIVKAEIQKSAGRPKGSGVVRFENEADAQVAIDQLNGYNYGGRELIISYASYP